MSGAVRILHLADSHIGVDLPESPRSGRRRRGDDIVASYRSALALARRHEVKLVIHAGDVFNRSRPGPAVLAAAAGPLFDLAADGVHVVVVPGNHERSRLPQSLLWSHPNIHVIDRPRTLSLRFGDWRVALAGWPYVRRQAAERFAGLLEETGWQRPTADLRILVVHQTFEAARCGANNYRFRSGPEVIERHQVPGGFDYVAAGHVHRHQVLDTGHPDGPPIVYSGSPDRITLAERDEPKGAVLLEIDGGGLTFRFLPLAVRPMVLIPLNVSGLDRAQVCRRAAEALAEAPIGALAVLRLTGATSAEVMRDIRLAQQLRRQRPDVLLRVVTRQLQWQQRHAPPEAATPPPAPATWAEARRRTLRVFDCLGQRWADVYQPASRCMYLPAARGTYALFDADLRLLYVGKATNVRQRVRSHVLGRTSADYYAGWTAQIAHVAVRPAHSDLEALLAEAELIRRFRPPFNRQMRSWQRYCYLCERPGSFGQLSISDQPAARGPCFGPYRSRHQAEQVIEAAARLLGLARCPEPEPSAASLLSSAANLCARYYDGWCCGPCAGKVDHAEYGRRLRRRNELLAGLSDAALAAAGTSGGRLGPGEIDTLRASYEWGVMLRRAAGLLGGWLILPGAGRRRAVVLLVRGGLRFCILEASRESALRIAGLHKRLDDGRSPTVVPKALVDCLCAATRAIDRGAEDCRLVPPSLARGCDARTLLAIAGLEGQAARDTTILTPVDNR